MKKFIHFFILIVLLFSSVYCADNYAFAIDGEIIQYDVYDENGNLLTFTSEAEVGDTILTKDFDEYQIYEIDGNKCYARYFRTLNWPKPDNSNEGKSANLSKKICLYMTHNDESYTPTDGYDSIYGAGGIHDVAKKIKDTFEKNGIEVVLDETLHIPHNSSAYSRSAVTAKSLYESENPDALFDIHRDGVSKSYYYTTNEGEPFSKVRIVVGKSNPNFEENYKFAQEVFAMGNQLYPWLFLDIYCGKGHYNQELMNTNLLFEMGTYLIEKEYVLNSVPYLVDAIQNTMYASVYDPEKELIPEEEFIESQTPSSQEESNTSSATSVVVVGLLLGGLLIFAFVSTIKRKKFTK